MINPEFASHRDLLKDLGLDSNLVQPGKGEDQYLNEYQLTQDGELYNLSEAAAWLTNKCKKTNVIVLNHYSGILPQIFMQHIKDSDKPEVLKKDVEALKCMHWLDEEDPIKADWNRESREQVTYARSAKIEEVLAQLKAQVAKENYVVIFPEI